MAASLWLAFLIVQCAGVLALAAAIAQLLPPSRLATLAIGLALYVCGQCLLMALPGLLAGARPARAPATPGRGTDLTWLLREAVAFNIAVGAMCTSPWRRAPDVVAPAAGRALRPVLLVHGVLCNREVWRGLARHLGAAGFAPVRTLNLGPLLADIDAHAQRVGEVLLQVHAQAHCEPVSIVAHSMGGLVARAVLRDRGPAAIRQIITVATPHHGSVLAEHLPAPPFRQMRRSSGWLQALNRAQEGRLPVPVTSLYSLDDPLIVPPRSAALAGAHSIELSGPGHFGILRSAQGRELILAALGTAPIDVPGPDPRSAPGPDVPSAGP